MHRGQVGQLDHEAGAAAVERLLEPDAAPVRLGDGAHLVQLVLAQALGAELIDAQPQPREHEERIRSGVGERCRLAVAGAELAGKTLGVLGLGRIGREVARRALADLGLEPAVCEGRAAIEAAIAAGRPVATEDAAALARAFLRRLRTRMVTTTPRSVASASGRSARFRFAT